MKEKTYRDLFMFGLIILTHPQHTPLEALFMCIHVALGKKALRIQYEIM